MGEQAWYSYPRGEAHKGVQAEVQRIRDQQAQQRRDIVHYMRLYAAGNVAGLGNVMPIDRVADYLVRHQSGPTRFNMTAALVDTAVSMIAQTPAIPVYLTTSGDFGLMRKARKRSQTLQGQMNDLTGDLILDVYHDVAVTGTGVVHGFINSKGLLEIERVHPLEILVEHSDGLYCKPRSMHRIRIRSKEELKALYPSMAWAIESGGGPSQDAVTDFFLDQTSDRSEVVEVWESYHLPCGKRNADGTFKKAGRRTVCIANATLEDDPWHEEEHCFQVVRYRKRPFGFFGAGLAESCRESQNRINDLIARVARGQDLGSNIVVVNPVSGDMGVKPSQITNQIGLVLNVPTELGGAPSVVKWDGTQWDLQEQIKLELERAMFVEGLSQSQANGEGAGRGLTSGVALRAADDMQGRRLVSPIKRLQTACIGVAKMIERLNDQLASEDESYEVRAKYQQGRQTFLLTSRWAELEIPDGHAQVDMMPMSALPTTPQGRWAAVMEWIEGGMVDRTYGMQLLQFPDIDSYADTQLAHIDIAQWQVEHLLDGEDLYPYPRQNLQVAMDIVTRSELKAITMGATPEVLDAFERFLVRCEDMAESAQLAAEAKQLQQQARNQPPQPMQPGAPQPGAQPGPRPVPQQGPAGPQQLVQAPPMRPSLQQVVA